MDMYKLLRDYEVFGKYLGAGYTVRGLKSIFRARKGMPAYVVEVHTRVDEGEGAYSERFELHYFATRKAYKRTAYVDLLGI